ncbi:DUF3071 domain-containing protein [Cellulomonas sp. DKR-3]|uniref:DUF3071 domain-containing protein n=1 Tax=Cellulomonas fulva TaxID=2835530 RepID=A0ABS5U0G5_9CELL|nr:septation protein SepH [Cellulomonas fulva]MBT0994894.1 DUF3071 domain-containing protein [Cellulomonas fulva]
MDELELVGLHDDGEHLVLSRGDGQRFRLRIDEALRAAVRRDRPQLEQLRAESAGTLSPREIQARIRAGATTQEVAEGAGITVEHVRRFEGPVLAEREYVAEQARATRVRRESDAPVLGDLVTDRLAARGVDLSSLAWDAAREPSGPWYVLARFTVEGSPHEARWAFDATARTLVADEDEARWLSETELPDEPVARRHLAAVRDVVFDFDSVATARGARPAGGVTRPGAPDAPDDDTHEQPAVDPQEQTAALLDDLRGRRGVRQAVEQDDDEDAGEFEGFGPQHAFDFARLEDVPGAHPVDADPQAEAVVLPVHLRGRARSSAPEAGTSEPGTSEAGTKAADTRAADTDEATAGDATAETAAASSARPADESASRSGGADGPTAAEPTAASADAPAEEQRPRTRKGRAKVPSWDEIVFGARPE